MTLNSVIIGWLRGHPKILLPPLSWPEVNSWWNKWFLDRIGGVLSEKAVQWLFPNICLHLEKHRLHVCLLWRWRLRSLLLELSFCIRMLSYKTQLGPGMESSFLYCHSTPNHSSHLKTTHAVISHFPYRVSLVSLLIIMKPVLERLSLFWSD